MQIISKSEAKALGLKKYFTGKPCKRGHVTERWINGGCYQCKLEDSLAWKKRNAEHVAAYKKEHGSRPEVRDAINKRLREKRASDPDAVRRKEQAYRDANREKRRELSRNWKAKNRDRMAAESRAYYWANREAVLERTRLKNRANPESNRSRVKAWEKANPEKKRAQSALYRLRHPERMKEFRDRWRKKNPDALRAIKAVRRAREKKLNGSYTRHQIRSLAVLQRHKCANCKTSVKTKYHADHIVPLALGGSNDILNIQLLCPSCNYKKNAKHPIDWAQENGRLL